MQFEERGQIEVKGKGAAGMYFVDELQNSEITTRISDLLYAQNSDIITLPSSTLKTRNSEIITLTSSTSGKFATKTKSQIRHNFVLWQITLPSVRSYDFRVMISEF